MWSPPPRPNWVAQINTVGAALGGPEQLIPLHAGELMEAARHGTGLEDFGPDDWQDAFHLLLDSLNREAQLNTAGRLLTRIELIMSLQNRLRIQEAIRRNPEILDTPIEKPVFICGLPRTGTSITHELMALDPRLHEPRAWEVFFSTPAPEPASYETDPRIPQADALHKLFDSIAPEYQTMHENGGALPVECLYIQMQQFVSVHFRGCMNVPSYDAWISQCDWQPVFAYQKRLMQVLQWKMPGRRWILKSPIHMERLPDLFAAFPDAMVILNHRDPLRSLASALSLMTTLKWMRCDQVDLQMARHLPRGFAALHEHVMRQRASGQIPDERIIDLHYRDLMQDPVACLQQVYARIGLPFGAEEADTIRHYLANKPKGKHGAHQYRLEDFGLTESGAKATFDKYCNHYGIQRE